MAATEVAAGGRLTYLVSHCRTAAQCRHLMSSVWALKRYPQPAAPKGPSRASLVAIGAACPLLAHGKGSGAGAHA
jgi:hypothetical protein